MTKLHAAMAAYESLVRQGLRGDNAGDREALFRALEVVHAAQAKTMLPAPLNR